MSLADLTVHPCTPYLEGQKKGFLGSVVCLFFLLEMHNTQYIIGKFTVCYWLLPNSKIIGNTKTNCFNCLKYYAFWGFPLP